MVLDELEGEGQRKSGHTMGPPGPIYGVRKRQGPRPAKHVATMHSPAT